MGPDPEVPRGAPFCSAGGIAPRSLANAVSPTIQADGGTGAEIFNNADGDVDGFDGNEGDSEHEEHNEHGVARPRLLTAPNPPSKQERLEHEISHLPYRTWCPHCVRGKAKCHYHKMRENEEERTVPVVAFDYAFLTKTAEDDVCKDELTVVVGKDAKTKCVFPIPVPQKGVDDNEYSVRCISRVLNALGYPKMILRYDQESALGKVLNDVKLHHGDSVQLVPELRPKNDSKSAGLVERANQTVEGQIRVMLSAIEEKLGTHVQPSDDIFPWLVLHAGTVLNRFDVQAGSGKTPWELLKGRKSRKEIFLCLLDLSSRPRLGRTCSMPKPLGFLCLLNAPGSRRLRRELCTNNTLFAILTPTPVLLCDQNGQHSLPCGPCWPRALWSRMGCSALMRTN